MATHNDPDHHDVFPGGKAGVEVKSAKPVFTVTRDAITRHDEHGNVTVWKLLTAPERLPQSSNLNLPYVAQAISTFNGAHSRKISFRMSADIALAWQMAQ
jgi:hypothetical protein